MNINDYQQNFPSLNFQDLGDRVLEISLNSGKLNPVSIDMHRELTYVWRKIDEDIEVNAVLIRGEGAGFSAGGSFELIEKILASPHGLLEVWKEARDLVYNVINCSKPIVSAIHAPVWGLGWRWLC
ncbi:MAG: enoyl-CoA hydratase/isomerase family protein [Deinococcales bacterium]